MLKMIRIVLALVLLSATSAQADTHIISDNAKNDGQRWNIDKQGAFCSGWKAAAGFTMMANVSMADTTVTPIMMNFSTGGQGSTGAADQFQWMMLNAKWTTDYANATNSVIIQFSDANDSGFFEGDKAITLTVGAMTHHALTCILNGTGAPPVPAHNCVWYVNGVASGGSWTETFGEAAVGPIFNCAQNMYIAAHLKSGGAIVDYSDFDGADFRTYSRALTAAEVLEIYKQKGRDNIRRGLISRYPFWTDGKNVGPNGISAIAEHSAGGTHGNPTVTATKSLSGARRRVM